MKAFHTWLTLGLVLFASFVLTTCGGGGGGGGGGTTESSGTTYVFRDDGGVSTLTLSASSYSMSGNGHTEGGSVTRLDNGFLIITKKTTSDASDPDLLAGQLPKNYYAFEFPGVALFAVDPTPVPGEIPGTIAITPGPGQFTISHVGLNEGGSCPADGTKYNAIVTTDQKWNSLTQAAYAEVTFNKGATPTTFDERILGENWAGSTAPSNPKTLNLNNVSCSGAIASGDEGTIIFTSAGVALLDWDTGYGYVMLPQPTDALQADGVTPITTNTQIVTELHREGRRFRGIQVKPFNWDDNVTVDDSINLFDTEAMELIVTTGNLAANAQVGDGYTDVTTNTLSGGGGALSYGESGTEPLGILSDGIGSNPIRTVATQIKGRWVTFTIAQEDYAGSTGPDAPEDYQAFFLIEDNVAYTAPPTAGSTTRSYVIPDGGTTSYLDIFVDKGSFLVTDDLSTPTLKEWGTFELLSNGFTKINLTHSTVVNSKTPDTLAGLEVGGGQGSLIQLFDQDDQTGINRGMTGFRYNTCPGPSSNIPYNLITAPKDPNQVLDTAIGGDDEFLGSGVLLEDGAGNYSLTPDNTWFLLTDSTGTGNISEPPALTGGTCPTTTIVEGFGGSTNQVTFFPNGLAYMDDPAAPTADGVIMMPLADVTPKDNVNYAGWAEQARWDDNNSSWVMEVTPVYATGIGSGKLAAGPYANVFTNSKMISEGGTINLNIGSMVAASGRNHLGTVSGDGGSQPFPYMVMEDPTNSSKQILVGIVYDANTTPATDGQSDWMLLFLKER